MNDLIPKIQARVKTNQTAKYVDEDWGQLDYYSPNHPVQWPVVLIDIAQAGFSNIGMDKKATPMQRQMGDTLIRLTFANLKLTNTSGRAPQLQKDQARSIWELVDEVHKLLHGWNLNSNTTKLIRTRLQRIKRDDGIQEIEVFYSCEVNNI